MMKFIIILIIVFHPISINFNSQILNAKTKKKKSNSFAKQKTFIKIIDKHREEFKLAKNDIQKSVIKEKRKKAINKLLKKRKVRKWTGIIKRLTTSKSGKIILLVEIADGISLQTQKSDMLESFAKTNTLIKKESKLYNKLLNLSEGTKIKLIGKFINSKDGTVMANNFGMNSVMLYPSYLFKFINIKTIE